MIAALAAGFVLGLAGSAHCAGMCGPLTLIARRGLWLHHTGRVATYVTLGVLAGLTGGIAVDAGHASLLSVIVGIGLILGAIGGRRAFASGPTAGPVSLLTLAMSAVGHWRRRHGASGALAFGALNGLLPCGLVYVALAGSAGLGDPMAAAAFMAGFGAGSLPALMAVALSANAAGRAVPARWQRAAPIAIALVGVLLVARGLWPSHDHALAAHPPSHLTAR